MKSEMLRMDNVTFIENGVKLLDQFNFQVFKGEIMGIIAINSHGLNTFCSLLEQNLPLHYGRVYYRETLVNSHLSNNSTYNKVAIIEKESRLVEGMTVGDNVFVLRRNFKKYIIKPTTLKNQLELFTKDLNFNINCDELVGNLSFFHRCVVELLKAVLIGSHLIVIRDISNFVSVTDLEKIHKLIRHYKTLGISFIYVCNHHQEAVTICDRISLFKNGEVLKIFPKNKCTDEAISPYVSPFYTFLEKKSERDPSFHIEYYDNSRLCFKAHNINGKTIKNLNFSVYKGECIVIHDLDETLIEEFVMMLMGDANLTSGNFQMKDRLWYNSPASKRDVAIISEKPSKSMLFEDLNYLDNLCFALDHRVGNVWLHKNVKNSLKTELSEQLGDVFDRSIDELSTKERYTLVYTRILLQKPKVVFCIQPFIGADMLLRIHILKLLEKLLEDGISVVILTLGISDSLAVANRLLTCKNGAICEE